jgi:hypothetical protein
MADAPLSQKINSLPQMLNQQFSADRQGATMSPRHLDHFELRTEMPPRPAVVFGRVKSHGDLEFRWSAERAIL